MSRGFVLNSELNVQLGKSAFGIKNQLQQALNGTTIPVNLQVNATSLGAIKSSLSNIAQAQAQINKSTINPASSKAISNIQSLNSSLSNSKKNADAAARGLRGFSEQIGSTARRLSAFVLAASAIYQLNNAIREAFRETTEYQRELVKVAQVGNDSRSGIQGLSKDITSLSTTLGVSSLELAKVSVTLRQAGFSLEDTRKVLGGIAKTDVTPTFENLEHTTEGVIAIFNQFNVKAEDLEKKLGAINRVAAQYAVESSDLITAIQKTGGAFRAAGGNLEELLALITSVRSTTRESADTIATAFRTIFARLQRPQVIEELKDLNIQLSYTKEEAAQAGKNIQGQFVGPFEAIQRLSKALNSVPTGSKLFAQIVEDIGGIRQISKVIPLLQNSQRALEAYNLAKISGNSLDRDATTAQNSYLIQLRQLKEEFLDLFRIIGSNPTINIIAKGMLAGAEAAIKLTKAIEPLIPLFAAIAGVNILKSFSGIGKGLKAPTPGLVANSGKPLATGGQADGMPVRVMPGEGIVRPQHAKYNYAKLDKLNKGGKADISNIPVSIVPGHGDTDSVPTILPKGSYVIRKSVTKKLRGYETGGVVPAKATSPKLKLFQNIDDYESAERTNSVGKNIILNIRKYEKRRGIRLDRDLRRNIMSAGKYIRPEEVPKHVAERILYGRLKDVGKIYNVMHPYGRGYATGGSVKLDNFRGVSNRTIVNRLAAAATSPQGLGFRNFYDLFRERLPITNPDDRQLFNSIYASQSFGAQDKNVIRKSINIYKKFKESGSVDPEDYVEHLRPLGTNLKNRKKLLKQVFESRTVETPKLGNYFKALNDPNFFPIDRNVITTALGGKTLDIKNLKLTKPERSHIEKLLVRAAKKVGLSPQQVQASIFAHRSKYKPKINDTLSLLDNLKGFADGGKIDPFEKFPPQLEGPKKTESAYRPQLYHAAEHYGVSTRAINDVLAQGGFKPKRAIERLNPLELEQLFKKFGGDPYLQGRKRGFVQEGVHHDVGPEVPYRVFTAGSQGVEATYPGEMTREEFLKDYNKNVRKTLGSSGLSLGPGSNRDMGGDLTLGNIAESTGLSLDQVLKKIQKSKGVNFSIPRSITSLKGAARKNALTGLTLPYGIQPKFFDNLTEETLRKGGFNKYGLPIRDRTGESPNIRLSAISRESGINFKELKQYISDSGLPIGKGIDPSISREHLSQIYQKFNTGSAAFIATKSNVNQVSEPVPANVQTVQTNLQTNTVGANPRYGYNKVVTYPPQPTAVEQGARNTALVASQLTAHRQIDPNETQTTAESRYEPVSLSGNPQKPVQIKTGLTQRLIQRRLAQGRDTGNLGSQFLKPDFTGDISLPPRSSRPYIIGGEKPTPSQLILPAHTKAPVNIPGYGVPDSVLGSRIILPEPHQPKQPIITSQFPSTPLVNPEPVPQPLFSTPIIRSAIPGGLLSTRGRYASRINRSTLNAAGITGIPTRGSRESSAVANLLASQRSSLGRAPKTPQSTTGLPIIQSASPPGVPLIQTKQGVFPTTPGGIALPSHIVSDRKAPVSADVFPVPPLTGGRKRGYTAKKYIPEFFVGEPPFDRTPEKLIRNDLPAMRAAEQLRSYRKYVNNLRSNPNPQPQPQPSSVSVPPSAPIATATPTPTPPPTKTFSDVFSEIGYKSKSQQATLLNVLSKTVGISPLVGRKNGQPVYSGGGAPDVGYDIPDVRAQLGNVVTPDVEKLIKTKTPQTIYDVLKSKGQAHLSLRDLLAAGALPESYKAVHENITSKYNQRLAAAGSDQRARRQILRDKDLETHHQILNAGVPLSTINQVAENIDSDSGKVNTDFGSRVHFEAERGAAERDFNQRTNKLKDRFVFDKKLYEPNYRRQGTFISSGEDDAGALAAGKQFIKDSDKLFKNLSETLRKASIKFDPKNFVKNIGAQNQSNINSNFSNLSNTSNIQGFFRSSRIMPGGVTVANNLTAAQLSSTLAHELGHAINSEIGKSAGTERATNTVFKKAGELGIGLMDQNTINNYRSEYARNFNPNKTNFTFDQYSRSRLRDEGFANAFQKFTSFKNFQNGGGASQADQKLFATPQFQKIIKEFEKNVIPKIEGFIPKKSQIGVQGVSSEPLVEKAKTVGINSFAAHDDVIRRSRAALRENEQLLSQGPPTAATINKINANQGVINTAEINAPQLQARRDEILGKIQSKYSDSLRDVLPKSKNNTYNRELIASKISEAFLKTNQQVNLDENGNLKGIAAKNPFQFISDKVNGELTKKQQVAFNKLGPKKGQSEADQAAAQAAQSQYVQKVRAARAAKYGFTPEDLETVTNNFDKQNRPSLLKRATDSIKASYKKDGFNGVMKDLRDNTINATARGVVGFGNKFNRIATNPALLFGTHLATSLIGTNNVTGAALSGGIQGASLGGYLGAELGGGLSKAGSSLAAKGGVTGGFGKALVGVGSLLGPVAAIGGAFLLAKNYIDDFNKSLRQADFQKQLGEFSHALGRAVSTGNLEQPGFANNLDKIQANIRKETPLLGESGLTTGESLRSLFVGREGIEKDRKNQRDQYIRENLGNLAEPLAQYGNKIAGKVTNLTEFSNFNGGSGRKIIQTLAQIQGIPAKDVADNFKDLIKSSQDLKRTNDKIASANSAVSKQITNFEQLSFAVESAYQSINKFDNSLTNITSISDGVSPGNIGGHAQSLGLFGSNNTAAFNDSVNFVTDTLGKAGGGKISSDLGSTAKGINRATQVLPGILEGISSNPLDSTDISAKLRQQLDAAGSDIPKEVKSQLVKVFDAIDPKDVLAKASEDSQKFARELADKAFPSVIKVLEDAARKLEDNANHYNQGLVKNQELIGRFNDSLSRADELVLSRERTRAQSTAEGLGRPSDAGKLLSIRQLETPFVNNQRNLTGFSENLAVDPRAIAGAIRSTLSAASAEVSRQPKLSGEDLAASSRRLVDLQGSAQRLKQALENLTDVTKTTAAAQEKLAEVRSEKDARLNLVGDFIKSDTAGRIQLQQQAAITQLAARVGIRNLPTAQHQAVALGFAERLGNASLPGLGGIKGNDLALQFKKDFAPGFTKDLDDQETALQKKIDSLQTVAIQAQNELSKILGDEQKTFFAELNRSESEFFSELSKQLGQANRLQNQAKAREAEGGVAKALNPLEAAQRLQGRGFSIDAALKLGNSETVRSIFSNEEKVSSLEDLKKDKGAFRGLSLSDTRQELINRGVNENIVDKVIAEKKSLNRAMTPEESDRIDREISSSDEGKRVLGGNGGLKALSDFKSYYGINSNQDLAERIRHGSRFEFNASQTDREAFAKRIESAYDQPIDTNKLKDSVIDRQIFDLRNNQNVDLLRKANQETGVPQASIASFATGGKQNLRDFEVVKKGVDDLGLSSDRASEALNKFRDSVDSALTELSHYNRDNSGNEIVGPPSVLKDTTTPAINDALDTTRRAVTASLGNPLTFASGGMVPFKPVGTDTVPAMLSPGEVVVSRANAQKNSGILAGIQGGTRYFAGGGYADDDQEKRVKQRVNEIRYKYGYGTGFLDKQSLDDLDQQDEARRRKQEYDAQVERDAEKLYRQRDLLTKQVKAGMRGETLEGKKLANARPFVGPPTLPHVDNSGNAPPSIGRRTQSYFDRFNTTLDRYAEVPNINNLSNDELEAAYNGRAQLSQRLDTLRKRGFNPSHIQEGQNLLGRFDQVFSGRQNPASAAPRPGALSAPSPLPANNAVGGAAPPNFNSEQFTQAFKGFDNSSAAFSQALDTFASKANDLIQSLNNINITVERNGRIEVIVSVDALNKIRDGIEEDVKKAILEKVSEDFDRRSNSLPQG